MRIGLQKKILRRNLTKYISDLCSLAVASIDLFSSFFKPGRNHCDKPWDERVGDSKKSSP